MNFLSIFTAIALASTVQAGWITYQNEGKQKEGIPCVGSVYGNDNYLISQFDCNAPDWNGTMCHMKCFPLSPTTCIGFPTQNEMDKGHNAGIWYAPHGNDDGCIYLGSTFGGDYSDRIGPNTTGCGYIDWPYDRQWGPVKSKPNGDEHTKGCWETDNKPDSKYNRPSVHYYDGARPFADRYCSGGFAESCGIDKDHFCHYNSTVQTEITCPVTTPRPDNPELK